MKPRRVGIDATTWWNDRGFGRFTRELLAALARRDAGFHYTLLTDRPPDDSLPENVAVKSVAGGPTLNESAVGAHSRPLSYFWRMGRGARAARFDLFFFPAVYSYFPLLARIPCVICFHDTTAERVPELLFPTRRNHRLWQIKTAAARFQATRVMTVSESSAEDLTAILRIPRERIDLVSEAPGPAFRVLESGTSLRVRHRLGLPAEGDLFVYVGGMNPHKNLMGLLRAMARVVRERPNVSLAIVGDTSGRGFWDDVPGLKRFVEEHPALPRHVRFVGYLPDSDLAALLNGAAALVFPSLWEGFGLPAVEAMACGTPVLASRRGSLPEVVSDAGLFFDPEDPDAIAACALSFLGDPPRRRQLSERAVARAASFTWERAAELAERSFENALHRSES